MRNQCFGLEPDVGAGAGARLERRRQRSAAGLVQVSLAHREAELQAAYELVYQRYLKEGYQAPTPGKLRFVAHCCLPSTYTFVARVRDQVIATLSLIADGELGLPLEQEYADEVAQLRAGANRLAEVSCLATRRFGDRAVFLRLMRTMYAFARHHLQMDACCIAVHPRQRRFYEKVLQFRVIGDEREYHACIKAPAIAMCLDLAGCEERMASRHGDGMVGRFFLGEQDYRRAAVELASVARDAVRARYAFSRRQLSRHAVSREDREGIIRAFRGCFGIGGEVPEPV